MRGPFSALYGSDAIGGVVQIFTRPAAGRASPAGRRARRATQGQGQGSAFVSVGEGPFSATASYRYVAFDGDRPNTDWRQRNGSASLEARLSEAAGSASRGPSSTARSATRVPVGAPSTARGFFREERLAVPGSFAALRTRTSSTSCSPDVRSEPAYRDTDGGFASQTDAETLQARVSDTARLGAHQLTALASWERWKVDDASNFGTNLDEQRTTLWGVGAQDSATLGPVTVTAGLRYDHHSAFGDAWSPRGTIAWLSRGSLWKVRVSGGTAFRAPSVGELYYPFVGNPDLKPERSVSWEVGRRAVRRAAAAPRCRSSGTI